jgi:DNA replication protein DnaC
MSNTNLVNQMKSLSHELRLIGINQNIAKNAEIAMANQLHPLEYLKIILEDEKSFRRERAAKALKTRAKFRSDAELEDWDHAFPRGLTKPKFKEIASLQFYQNKESMLITGSTGTGKTHLAIALGKKLCGEGVSVQFYSVNLLFEAASAEKLAGRYLQFVKKLKQVAVLILDDFGLRNYTHDEATILLDVLEERYLKGSIILTSQVEPQGWGKLFEDPVIADAIVDRLTKPTKTVPLKGPSFRDQPRIKKPVESESVLA